MPEKEKSKLLSFILNKKNITIALLLLCIFCLIIIYFNSYSYKNNLQVQSLTEQVQNLKEELNKNKNSLEDYKKQITDLQKEKITLEEKNKQLESDKEKLEQDLEQLKISNSKNISQDNSSNTSSTLNDSYTVYITNSGKKYHSADCSYLSKSKISIDKNSAISRGYTPCSKCNP